MIVHRICAETATVSHGTSHVTTRQVQCALCEVTVTHAEWHTTSQLVPPVSQSHLSVSQSPSLSVSPPVSQSVPLSVSQCPSLSVSPPVSQSVPLSVSQSPSLSASPPVSQSVPLPVSQSPCQSVSPPPCQSVPQPVSQSVPLPVSQSPCQSVSPPPCQPVPLTVSQSPSLSVSPPPSQPVSPPPCQSPSQPGPVVPSPTPCMRCLRVELTHQRPVFTSIQRPLLSAHSSYMKAMSCIRGLRKQCPDSTDIDKSMRNLHGAETALKALCSDDRIIEGQSSNRPPPFGPGPFRSFFLSFFLSLCVCVCVWGGGGYTRISLALSENI